MSLLRDGRHRRAPLTARFGAARFGAARFGCVYGQNDLATLTREIKDENLTGTGPFYVWAEAIDTLFAGQTQYISSTGICAIAFAISTTVDYAYSVNLTLGADSTDYFNPAMLVNLSLSCGSDEDVTFTSGSDMGSPSREQNPDPRSPSRQRLLRGH